MPLVPDRCLNYFNGFVLLLLLLLLFFAILLNILVHFIINKRLIGSLTVAYVGSMRFMPNTSFFEAQFGSELWKSLSSDDRTALLIEEQV